MTCTPSCQSSSSAAGISAFVLPSASGFNLMRVNNVLADRALSWTLTTYPMLRLRADGTSPSTVTYSTRNTSRRQIVNGFRRSHQSVPHHHIVLHCSEVLLNPFFLRVGSLTHAPTTNRCQHPEALLSTLYTHIQLRSQFDQRTPYPHTITLVSGRVSHSPPDNQHPGPRRCSHTYSFAHKC